MVYCGKASLGCSSCRKRRIKVRYVDFPFGELAQIQLAVIFLSANSTWHVFENTSAITSGTG